VTDVVSNPHKFTNEIKVEPGDKSGFMVAIKRDFSGVVFWENLFVFLVLT